MGIYSNFFAVGGIFFGEIGAFFFGLLCGAGGGYILYENKQRIERARAAVTAHFDALIAVPLAEADAAQIALDKDKVMARQTADIFEQGGLPPANFVHTNLPNIILKTDERILAYEPCVNHSTVIKQGFVPGEDGSLIITKSRVIFLSEISNIQFSYPDVLTVKVDGDGIILVTLNTQQKAVVFYVLGSAYRISALIAGFSIASRKAIT